MWHLDILTERRSLFCLVLVTESNIIMLTNNTTYILVHLTNSYIL